MISVAQVMFLHHSFLSSSLTRFRMVLMLFSLSSGGFHSLDIS